MTSIPRYTSKAEGFRTEIRAERAAVPAIATEDA